MRWKIPAMVYVVDMSCFWRDLAVSIITELFYCTAWFAAGKDLTLRSHEHLFVSLMN